MGKVTSIARKTRRFFFICASAFVKAEDYESGDRVVYVSHALPNLGYGRLPLDDWRRIGKRDGFACRASSAECAVFFDEEGRMHAAVERLSADERFDRSIALLSCSLGKSVVLVLKSHKQFELISENLQSVGLIYNGDYAYMANFFFSDFQSALDSLKNKVDQQSKLSANQTVSCN